jgi:hypothetical protein
VSDEAVSDEAAPAPEPEHESRNDGVTQLVDLPQRVQFSSPEALELHIAYISNEPDSFFPGDDGTRRAAWVAAATLVLEKWRSE